MGSELVVVGTGIQIGRDLTKTSRHHIESADKVFYLVSDPIAARTIVDLNESAESLHTYYNTGKRRLDTYHEMVEGIMTVLRQGKKVCVAVYGHPGIFAYPMHVAIKRAREERIPASMLPAVSSIDCLIADLGLDPAETGLQIYDASDFVVSRRNFDPTTALVLLQIDVVGDPDYWPQHDCAGLPLLRERLIEHYGADHVATIYSASEFVWGSATIRTLPLGTLSARGIDSGSILVIRPAIGRTMDERMTQRLDALLASARKN
ncbi:MAG: hypothetical protein JO219_00640 [Candidatus Eremiobacteraeota bacterium]|nr:hypothetical protein [Candidatus Eremiobacteraeota bacterium]MBV8366824.1 hypothetical protein [Candidatus Eremiobacteraeota bacterium]